MWAGPSGFVVRFNVLVTQPSHLNPLRSMPSFTCSHFTALLGAITVAALAVASATPLHAQSITSAYTVVGPTDVLTAPFASSSGTITTDTFSGPVEIQVSGTGDALFSNTSDAFYFTPSQTETSPARGDLELAIRTPAHPLLGEADGQGGMSDAIKYDLVFINGVGAVSPGTIPAYSSLHSYDFVIDVPDPTATALTFGVNDGGYGDNSGSYRITVTQLAVPEPSTWVAVLGGMCLFGLTLYRGATRR